MSNKFKIKSEWFIFGLFLLLYLIFPNNNPGYDSYSYAISAKDSSDLFHPHHLIYNLFSYVIFSLFSFTGLGSLKILALANTIFAVFTLLFVHKIISRWSGNFEALAGTILTGSLYSFWYYATSAEVNMAAIFFTVVALYFLLAKEKSSAAGWLVYIFLCLGLLFHQIVALIGIPILIYDMIRSHSFTAALKRAHPGILAGALIYAIVAIENTDTKNAAGIYNWITQYGHAGEWGKLGVANISQSVWGKIKGLYGGEIVREIFYSGQWDIITIFAIVVMVLIYLGLAYLFLTTLLNLYKIRDRERILILALVLILALFSFWWAPHDDGFWLYPFVYFCLLVFLKPLSQKIQRIVAVSTIVLLFILNISCEFIPSANKNNSYIYQGAMAFKRLSLTANDLVITNLSQTRLAYEYYTGIHVPTTCMMFLPPGKKDSVIDGYHQRITETLNSARVYMFEDEIYPDEYRSYLFSRFSIDDYTDTYSRYSKHLEIADSVYIHGRYVKVFRLKPQDR